MEVIMNKFFLSLTLISVFSLYATGNPGEEYPFRVYLDDGVWVDNPATLQTLQQTLQRYDENLALPVPPLQRYAEVELPDEFTLTLQHENQDDE